MAAAARVLRLAKLAIRGYNLDKNSDLELQKVISVFNHRLRPSESRMIIQACNPAAGGVPIQLKAICSLHNHQIRQISPVNPVPFVRVDRRDKKPRNMEAADRQALLFANLQNCPIIDKRLGLKRSSLKFLPYISRGKVVNLPKVDETLLSIAALAVKHRNASRNQRVRLRFLRVTGAWVESISKDVSVYHIMLVALEALDEKEYYAAVLTNARTGVDKCIDWVAADSPRPAICVPC